MNPHKIKKVLIIQTAFIGDVLLTEPLVRAVQTHFPELEIDFLVSPRGSELLINHPFINQLIIYDKRGQHRGVIHFFKLVRKIRARQYQLALLPHRSWRSALLSTLAGIPIRIGFDRSSAHWLYSHSIPYEASTHEIDRNLRLLSPFKVNFTERLPEIFPLKQEIQKVKNRLFPDGKEIKPLVALAPGSHWYTKRWPEPYFVRLAQQLIKRDFNIVLIGGKKDRPLCTRIQKKAGKEIVNLAGTLTLRETFVCLCRCRILVSNDSAPTHLGVAAGIPVISIFGSTSPALGFYPYGQRENVLEVSLNCRPCTDHGRRRCPKGTLECLWAITPGQVLQKIEELQPEIQSHKLSCEAWFKELR
ncbi:MAG: lipopolysaccharide heptosyltransferase II [Calditrichaeota bacterium]|nr:MAG: lipopolysaccharide heptosyltransferase II [Calditrichota bacterium]